MIKTILVPAGGSDTDNVVFETARVAAEPFAAHLAFFHVRVGTGEAALHTPHAEFARGRAMSSALSLMAEDARARSIAAARHVRDFCGQWRIPMTDMPSRENGMSASFDEELGHAPQRLMARARLNDLIVLGRFTRPNGLPPDLPEQLLRGCGRPIVIAGIRAPAAPLRTVMVCWKDAPEPARALGAAMPFLGKADRVVVVTVDEGETPEADTAKEVAEHLAWHGIRAEAQPLVGDGRPTATVLASAAKACEADLLVMGCYGHGRAHAVIYGSCTETLLRTAEVPIFLLH